MSGHLHVFACLVCLGVGPQVAAAQAPSTPSPPTAPPEQPTAVALRLNTGESIAVDGVLDEAAWERATPVGNFTQSEPRNGKRETERTEIRVLFSEDNLYIGAQFFDSDPRGMLGNQMVRDGGLNSDDRFMWVLDPLNDRRSGYFFEINPAGAMGDAQLVPSSGGSGRGVHREYELWLVLFRSSPRPGRFNLAAAAARHPAAAERELQPRRAARRRFFHPAAAHDHQYAVQSLHLGVQQRPSTTR